MNINNNIDQNTTDHLDKTRMETISKYLPNNNFYIARPNSSLNKTQEELVYPVGALKESLYVAYPKTTISDTANEAGAEIVVIKEEKRGPFISYPKNKATNEEKKPVDDKKANRSLNGGYVAQPKKVVSKFKKETVLRAPVALFKNNVIVLNLLQFLRLKVS